MPATAIWPWAGFALYGGCGTVNISNIPSNCKIMGLTLFSASFLSAALFYLGALKKNSVALTRNLVALNMFAANFPASGVRQPPLFQNSEWLFLTKLVMHSLFK